MANKITNFMYRALRGIFDISLLGAFLVGCQMQVAADFDYKDTDYEAWLIPPAEITGEVGGVILPHHILVEKYMDEFYSQLASGNIYDRIVILSPNHFGEGYSYIQTTSELEKEGVNLEIPWREKLVNSGLITVENKDFGMEHGVFVHYPFLAKYFPDAEVLPIIIKEETPCDLLKHLSNELNRLDVASNEKTLFLASLDFSHYTKENLAVRNDKSTIEWLQNPNSRNENLCLSAKDIAVSLSIQNEDAVAVDSPETLFVMADLMSNSYPNQFELWARTSSAALIPTLQPSENTSHIFGYYSVISPSS